MRSKWKLSEVYFFFVPESFRFLIAKGRIDDAKRCFKRFPLKRSKTEITNNPDSKNQNGNNYTDEIKETDLFIENGNKPLSSLPNYLTNAEQNPFAQVEQQNFLESVASMVSNQTLQDDYSNDQERFLKIIIKFTYQKHVSRSHWPSTSHTIWLISSLASYRPVRVRLFRSSKAQTPYKSSAFTNKVPNNRKLASLGLISHSV